MVRRVSARLLLAAVVPFAVCELALAAGPAPIVRVALAPELIDRMSGFVWRAMVEECGRIWWREGVALSWSGADAAAHVSLPLAFDTRAVRRHAPQHADAFGVTLFAGRSQRIVVSIARAREVVTQRNGLADSADGMTLDIATGMLLGRVVAHEIGHALLLTTRHAEHGLMRARFDAAAVRPAPAGDFALSASERRQLATRFSNVPGREPLLLAGFTWTDAPPAPSRPRAPR